MAVSQQISVDKPWLNVQTVKKNGAANNRTLLKKLNPVEVALYELEIAKAKIESKEPISAGFFGLQ